MGILSADVFGANSKGIAEKQMSFLVFGRGWKRRRKNLDGGKKELYNKFWKERGGKKEETIASKGKTSSELFHSEQERREQKKATFAQRRFYSKQKFSGKKRV